MNTAKKRSPKIFLISDTHFNHKKLQEYTGRPENADDLILRNIYKAGVTEEDTVIHLGDICIGRDERMHEQYIKQIPGTRILVKGNHDKRSDGWYRRHGWSFVCQSFVNRYEGLDILFAHIPVVPDYRYSIQIHGHTHGGTHRLTETTYDPSWHMEIALEVTNYKPVLLDTLIKKHHENRRSKKEG